MQSSIPRAHEDTVEYPNPNPMVGSKHTSIITTITTFSVFFAYIDYQPNIYELECSRVDI
jgi:hypothetical protein